MLFIDTIERARVARDFQWIFPGDIWKTSKLFDCNEIKAISVSFSS